MSRRALYAVGAVLCLAAAGGLFLYSRKKAAAEEKAEPEKPAGPAQKSEEKKPAETKKREPEPVAQKSISADELMKEKPDSIFGRTIVAKNDGSAIYTTTNKLVERTKKDEPLGKPFKHMKASNGTYNLKYQDANGNYRIINSAAVKVLL